MTEEQHWSQQSNTETPPENNEGSNTHEHVHTSANMHEDAPAGSATHEQPSVQQEVRELKNTEFSDAMITIADTKRLFENAGLIRNEVTLRRYCRAGKIRATQLAATADGSSPWLINEASAKKVYRGAFANLRNK